MAKIHKKLKNKISFIMSGIQHLKKYLFSAVKCFVDINKIPNDYQFLVYSR